MTLESLGPRLPHPRRGASVASELAAQVAELRRRPGEWLKVKEYDRIQAASTARGRMAMTHTDIDWASRTIDGKPWLTGYYPGDDQPTRRQSFLLIVNDDDGWSQLAEALVDRHVDLRLDDGEHLSNEKVIDIKPGAVVIDSGPDLHRDTSIPTDRITRIYLHAPPEASP